MQDGKFFSAFVNLKPFGDWKDSLLENFNIGGSVFAGNTCTSSPIPPTLPDHRATTTGNAVVGVPFLTLNSNVRESGPRPSGTCTPPGSTSSSP